MVLYDNVEDVSTLISATGSSACLTGTGACSSCTVTFNDPDYGIGCLSNNMDSSQNSYGTTCLTAGCTKLVELSCDYSNKFCWYDKSTHSCYTKDLSSDATSDSKIVVNCYCESPAVSRGTGCCNSMCKSCDYLDKCTECYSLNSVC